MLEDKDLIKLAKKVINRRIAVAKRATMQGNLRQRSLAKLILHSNTWEIRELVYVYPDEFKDLADKI